MPSRQPPTGPFERALAGSLLQASKVSPVGLVHLIELTLQVSGVGRKNSYIRLTITDRLSKAREQRQGAQDASEHSHLTARVG